MTMHLLHPGYSTLNHKQKKSKPTKKQQTALSNHELWLRSRGLHVDQLSQKKRGPTVQVPDYKSNQNLPKLSNQIASGIAGKKSIWEVVRKGQEDPKTVEQIQQKAKRTGIAYNKGGYMYLTDGSNPHDIGRK